MSQDIEVLTWLSDFGFNIKDKLSDLQYLQYMEKIQKIYKRIKELSNENDESTDEELEDEPQHTICNCRYDGDDWCLGSIEELFNCFNYPKLVRIIPLFELLHHLFMTPTYLDNNPNEPLPVLHTTFEYFENLNNDNFWKVSKSLFLINTLFTGKAKIITTFAIFDYIFQYSLFYIYTTTINTDLVYKLIEQMEDKIKDFINNPLSNSKLEWISNKFHLEKNIGLIYLESVNRFNLQKQLAQSF